MVGDFMTSSTRNFWSEIKVVWKNAKWQYFLKFFTSIAIRAILLIIPLLFSEAINLVTHNDYNKSIIILAFGNHFLIKSIYGVYISTTTNFTFFRASSI